MTWARWEDRRDERWIAVDGELDHVGCDEVAPSLREATRDRTARSVVFDLSAVSFITSRGIGLLLEARQRLMEQGRSIALAGLRPQVRGVLAMVGVLTAVPERAA